MDTDGSMPLDELVKKALELSEIEVDEHEPATFYSPSPIASG
jgi:hypothetical protein